MYNSKTKKENTVYKEVKEQLIHIRKLLKTRAGRELVAREVRDKWL